MQATVDGPGGIYAEIIQEADKRLPDYTIDLVSAPWPRAIFLTREGQAAGLVGTYRKTLERPWIRYYSTPLFEEEVFVFCRRGVAGPDWRYPEDYAGLVFANNLGFGTPGSAFFAMVKAGKIDLIEEQTTEENLRLIELGRADCYVQDGLATRRALKSEGLQTIDQIAKVLTETAHVGYSENWTGNRPDAFIAAMDRVLQDMTTDGTIARIAERSVAGE